MCGLPSCHLTLREQSRANASSPCGRPLILWVPGACFSSTASAHDWLANVLPLCVLFGSFGGRMAHLIACAAKAIGFAPRALVLIDPVPLAAAFPERVRRTRVSMRESAVAFLSLQLATLARMTESDDKFEEFNERLPAQVAAWPENELVVRVAGALHPLLPLPCND